MSIGDKLRSMRTLRGYTADELSIKAGVSRSYILQIEGGHRKNVSDDIIDKLAVALRIDSDYFKIKGNTIPTDSLELPQDIIELLKDADSMPYLKLTKKARFAHRPLLAYYNPCFTKKKHPNLYARVLIHMLIRLL